MNNDTILCACGCGQPVPKAKFPSQQRRFINFHQHRGNHNGNYRGGKVKKACAVCGDTFEIVPSLEDVRKTCGKDPCYRTWQGLTTAARGRNKIKVTCHACGKEFERWPSMVKDNKRVFCSEACHNGSRDDVANNYAHHWKGGSSRWKRKQAMKRDGNRCAICNFDVVVQVHHITSRADGGTDEFHNLITLCPNHHAMADLGIIDLEQYRNHDFVPDFPIEKVPQPNQKPKSRQQKDASR